MRRLKPIEIHKGMKYCTFCKREGKQKVPALWRSQYWGTESNKTQLACPLHKDLIVDGGHVPDKEPKQRKQEVIEDDHLTEADYQTWFNL